MATLIPFHLESTIIDSAPWVGVAVRYVYTGAYVTHLNSPRDIIIDVAAIRRGRALTRAEALGITNVR